MTLRVTVLNRYVELGRGRLGIAGWGRMILGRYTIFALQVER